MTYCCPPSRPKECRELFCGWGLQCGDPEGLASRKFVDIPPSNWGLFLCGLVLDYLCCFGRVLDLEPFS